jgi:hypothetical protein
VNCFLGNSLFIHANQNVFNQNCKCVTSLPNLSSTLLIISSTYLILQLPYMRSTFRIITPAIMSLSLSICVCFNQLLAIFYCAIFLFSTLWFLFLFFLNAAPCRKKICCYVLSLSLSFDFME